MASPKRENLTKLSLSELEELYKRQCSIVNNRKLVEKLPDKGKQLEEKLKLIKNEIKTREDVKDLEECLGNLKISEEIDVLNEKHVQHICNLEKHEHEERYKPFSSLSVKPKKEYSKPTKLIPLAESISLQVKQVSRTPVYQVQLKIEGSKMDDYTNNEEEDPKE